MNHNRRLLTSALLSVMIATGITVPAAANVTAASNPVEAYLAEHPGGVPLNDNEISYNDGELIVTLSPPVGAMGLPDCPAGYYCFYDLIDFGYPRGRLSVCGWQSLGGMQFRVESVHYNLTTGKAVFYSNDTALYQVTTSTPTLRDVSPYRNMANYAKRVCPSRLPQ